MPITDSYFVKGNVSLEEVCKLYSKLDKHIEKSRGFFHAKEHGFNEAYDSAREEVIDLINQSKKYGLDEFYSFFKEPIKKLKDAYNLK